MRARNCISLLLVALLVACENEVRVSEEAIVRDSAGVSIVEYPDGVGDPPMWLLETSPSTVLREVEGRPETLYSQIIAAFSGTDGTLVVADATSRELRWFDRDGEHIRTVGGRGEGPGEFVNLSRVRRLSPDTILAWDGSLRRVTLFSQDGEFLTSHVIVDVPEVFDAPPGRFIAGATPSIRGFFRDGSVLAHPMMLYIDVPAGIYRDSIPLIRFDPRVGSWERIGTTLPPEYFFDTKSNVLNSLPLPFGISTRTAVSDDWAVIGWGNDEGLTILDRMGQPRAIVRPNFTRVPVSRDEIEQDRRERVEARPEADREQYRRALESVSYPSLRPAHGAIVAGDDEFWVEALNGPVEQDINRWYVFSESGQVLASLEVPSEVRITDIQNDHLVGVVTDDLGVPRVVRFGLRRND
jgi:hypothetical protein